MRNSIKNILLMLLGAGGAIVFIDDATQHKVEAELLQNEYCKMVELHQKSGNEYGWPDYRKKYKELCKSE